MVKYTLKEKILKFLIENKESPHPIMEISKKLKADYKNTYNIINELSLKIISREKIGNTSPIKINLKISREIYNLEEKRTGEFLSKNPKLRLIQRDIEEIGYPFMIVLIFGSYVKKTKTKNSDVDICIISDSKEKTKRLIQSLNLLSLNLEIHEFTTNEFISMIEKTQNNLGHEIVKSNIILYSIENYYNLISKWMKKE